MKENLFPFRLPLYPGKAEKVLNNGIKAIHMLVDDFQESLRVFVVFGSTIPQGLHKTFDRCYGGLDLVGDIGHEISTNVFEFPKLGDVIQNNKRTLAFPMCVPQCRAEPVQDLFFSRIKDHILFNRCLAGQRIPHELL